MNRLLFAYIYLVVLAADVRFVCAEEVSGRVSFANEVRPIFQAHCTMCHGGVKNAGDLKLTDARSALSVIEPGNATKSNLFERITDEVAETRMPPADHGAPLSSGEIEIIRRWLDEGAEWSPHWAFLVPQNTTLPQVLKHQRWIRDPLDAWVANNWRSSPELQPSPESSPQQWHRKV